MYLYNVVTFLRAARGLHRKNSDATAPCKSITLIIVRGDEMYVGLAREGEWLKN